MKGRPNHFLRQFSSYVQRQANTEQNREAAALLLDRGLSNHIFSRLSAGFNTYLNKMSTSIVVEATMLAIVLDGRF